MVELNKKAPNFTLPDQDNTNHSLSSYAGKWVILYFYPKDMTSGCTTQACNFRDNFNEFKETNTVIIGISKDSPKRHATFIGKHNLPFILLSDENNTVCETYGVWQEKKMYGKSYMGIVRTTFLIDPSGKIAKVYLKVKVKDHVKAVIEDLLKLQE